MLGYTFAKLRQITTSTQKQQSITSHFDIKRPYSHVVAMKIIQNQTYIWCISRLTLYSTSTFSSIQFKSSISHLLYQLIHSCSFLFLRSKECKYMRIFQLKNPLTSAYFFMPSTSTKQ